MNQGALVGLLGLEPRTTEPKSAVLPLHHRPVPRCISKVGTTSALRRQK